LFQFNKLYFPPSNNGTHNPKGNIINNIKEFQSNQIRTVWNDEAGEWYFSVVDVVKALTNSLDPKQYIKKLRSRDQELNSKWGTICTPVKMLAPDGKMRKSQASNLEGILRIIQSIPSPKAEPFKLWMAQLGADIIAKPLKN